MTHKARDSNLQALVSDTGQNLNAPGNIIIDSRTMITTKNAGNMIDNSIAGPLCEKWHSNHRLLDVMAGNKKKSS